MNDALILTHGAGSNRDSGLLRALETAIESAWPGLRVERVNLAFRERKSGGPPTPAGAALDRAGLRADVERRRQEGAKRVFLGGVSYGGRQASMLASEEPDLVDGLLLLSYPLHPPGNPNKPRTAHLPALRTPALFVHGDRDPFGTLEEMNAALGLVGSARKRLVEAAKAGHDLGGGKGALPALIASAFTEFFGS